MYLETSIVSYLAAWPSRDLVTAARQRTTHVWWTLHRASYEVYVSQLVIEETGRGDPGAAARRLALLADLLVVDVSEEAKLLAQHLVGPGLLPPGSEADALHVAVAATHGMQYLLTWNCTHLASARIRPSLEDACRDHGYEPPVLCTPDELLEG